MPLRSAEAGLPADALPVPDVPTPAPVPAQLALCWLEQEESCRLIVDEELTLIWANPGARRALEGAGDLAIRDGQVALQNRTDHGRLQSFVVNCGTALSSLCIRQENGGGHLLLRGRAVSQGGDSAYFGLTFRYSEQPGSARYADLEHAFKLTNSEHKVLLRMIDGFTADQVAEQFTLSIETVRTHIRKIYVKTNVTSREALFYRLRPYRI